MSKTKAEILAFLLLTILTTTIKMLFFHDENILSPWAIFMWLTGVFTIIVYSVINNHYEDK